MYQRPLHLKNSLERAGLAAQPTEYITAISPVTEVLLPVDRYGRSYLVSFRRNHVYGTLWDDTVCQASELIELYRALSDGRYPSEIILRVERYFARRAERFYPFSDIRARTIPFKYEDAEASYEILVRGRI